MQIAGTEAVNMTPAQYDNAAEAVAVLITSWLHHHPRPGRDRGDHDLAA